ncbi:MAG TPA: hypothetical protein VFP06_10885, partial [Acidimicrobiales bacterium]|nr:hypothetical protein [Acidimicrobiales bacterium]
PAVARSAYVDPRVIERYEDGRTVGDELAGADRAAQQVRDAEPGGGDDRAGTGAAGEAGDAVDAVPAELLAEVDTAVVDLIEGSPRRRARPRRPRRAQR